MNTPIGVLEIDACLEGIQGISFIDDSDEVSSNPPELHVTKEARDQLNEYFNGRLLKFDLPLKYKGSEFQQAVWEEMSNVQYGRTISNLDLARKFGDARVVRSISSGLNKNPLPIIIPCHRIVNSKGKPTSYRWGMFRKKFLIELEHPFKQGVLF